MLFYGNVAGLIEDFTVSDNDVNFSAGDRINGADVVLFGTSSANHLEQNIASILAPPLPEADRARLAALFGHLCGVGLDLPGPPSRGA